LFRVIYGLLDKKICVWPGCRIFSCSSCKKRVPLCLHHVFLFSLSYGDTVWAEWDKGAWYKSTLRARVMFSQVEFENYVSERNGEQSRYMSRCRWMVETQDPEEDEVNLFRNMSSHHSSTSHNFHMHARFARHVPKTRSRYAPIPITS
jgi:hypothetical protein